MDDRLAILFVTRPPEQGEEFGFTIIFDIEDMTPLGTIDDRGICSVLPGSRLSEKLIPDYEDVLAIVNQEGGVPA